MDSQDGIPVRSMRLKVLYTFDDANKTNCLARWPHLLDIQTAHLDEDTQIGVIELKTCIQAIVSASPELVAKLGQDYTVYAYDYSEYETPLVGQGMLSWVLASASPTPNAPAHQSKTMVTGRVCKNVLGLFSKGVQETLEVKLRLVPVPTVKQSEYIESMQRYRELSHVIPHEFDAQTWTNFVRQNPSVLDSKTQLPDGPASSPVDHSGIERVRQILSEGSTPREFSNMPQDEPNQASSPPQSIVAPSRNSTPGGQRPSKQQPRAQKLQRAASQNDAIRPSSSASMQEPDFTTMTEQDRRGSIQSGYGSGDEAQDPQPRKRARLYRTKNPGKSDLNIEKQPSSLRVAASTAASVRIHRPIPVNPSIAAEQNSTAEPVRPPTPISNPSDMPRRLRPPPSMLREQSNLSNTEYTSPYPMSDDNGDQNAQSPEESRYQGLFEPNFSMPSSPPVLDCGFPGPSSPALPPIATDPDSGFMSGGVEDLLDDDVIPLDDGGRNHSNAAREKRTVRPAVNANSPASAASREKQTQNTHEGNTEQPPAKEAAPPLPRPPPSAAGSRPSSRGSVRLAPKPIAPAPISQSDVENIMGSVPASDPVMPQAPQYAQSYAGPMSDLPIAETPGPQSAKDGRPRSGTNKKKTTQIQARLDHCIRNGQAPPYCQNCGAIETPTWRRAWSKEIEGSEERANEMANDPTSFYWEALDRDDQGKVVKFKIVKKSLLSVDNDFTQVLLCNPCGLWLHKSKTMRPENRWYQDPNKNRKRKAKPKGPLNGGSQTTKPRKGQSGKPTESSPIATDESSPPEDGTPRPENNENDEDSQDPPSKRRRANSVEPRRSSDTAKSHWDDHDPMEALRRAIQSSPVRNLQRRDVPADKNLTPKPVRRALFTNSHNGGTPKALGETSGNSPRRSPRTAAREAAKQPQDKENQPGMSHEVDSFFENSTFDFDLPTSPTPRRRNTRAGATGEKRLSLPTQSPTRGFPKGNPDTTPTKRTAQMLQRIQGGTATPRQNKTRQLNSNGPSPVRQPQSNDTELPPLPDNFNAEAFEGMETMMANMFDNDSNADFFSFDPSKFTSGSEWAGWFASDAGTPVGSDEGHANGGQGSDDFFNAILSDPEMQKGNMQFDPFALGDSNVLDSGVFGSESLNPDVMMVGSKDKPTDQSTAGEQNLQETANNNAS